MPATNYTWSIDEKPIFQVYGTKRKNTCSQNDGSLDKEEEVEKKRRCTETRQCMDDDMIDSMDMFPDNQSPNCISNPASIQQPVVSMISTNQTSQLSNMTPFNNRVPPLPVAVQDCTARMDLGVGNLNNNNTHPAHGCQQRMADPSLQDSMIMDLNDEVYSTTTWPLNPQTDAEYEAACNMVAAMEAEGGPDPSQYKLSYCHPHCAGGNSSPTSGKVQCACKQSWEGLQDARPYVSDYY